MAFSHEIEVQLYDTDAYGILFFGAQFQFAHVAQQAFLASIGYPLRPVVEAMPFITIMVHAESDYLAQLYVGDRVRIAHRIAHVGTTSFIVACDFLRGDETVGRTRLVYVCADPAERRKQPLPEAFRAALLEHLDAEAAER